MTGDRTKDYVFLSYSHKDNVDNILQAFESRDYNIVYDTSMLLGEEWTMQARRYIDNEKCKGVIFVTSENSLTSTAVLHEVEYTKKYHKKSFCLLIDNKTMPELCHGIYDDLDDSSKYIMDCIAQNFTDSQLYVNWCNIDWDRIAATFADWGFRAEQGPASINQPLYTSELAGEHTRLENQQRGYFNFDKQALDSVLAEFDRDGLVVMDLGCANGALTFSRFAGYDRIKKVIGVDYNENDIRRASEAAEGYGGKFSFYHLDLEADDAVARLKAILKENGADHADIVFSALVLHHLNAPTKLLLRLYDIFGDDGKIIIRSADDGGKLCYPESELLQELLDDYSKLIASSDRSSGRKLYSQLYSTGYVGIRMMYQVVDTCEKDRRNRSSLFDVGFSYRLKRLDELVEANPGNAALAKSRDDFAAKLARFKEAFVDRSFWYCNTSYIAIAGVK